MMILATMIFFFDSNPYPVIQPYYTATSKVPFQSLPSPAPYQSPTTPRNTKCLPVKGKSNNLSSACINKMKLVPVCQALDRYHKLQTESKASVLAVKLAGEWTPNLLTDIPSFFRTFTIDGALNPLLLIRTRILCF